MAVLKLSKKILIVVVTPSLQIMYLNSNILTEEESNGIEGEITLSELQYALFFKMKGSSALGIDGFSVNWLRKFWDSLKLLHLEQS